jgi:hypothetical protein
VKGVVLTALRTRMQSASLAIEKPAAISGEPGLVTERVRALIAEHLSVDAAGQRAYFFKTEPSSTSLFHTQLLKRDSLIVLSSYPTSSRD